MERLQAALEKARQSRGHAPDRVPTTGPKAAPQPDGKMGDLWKAIPQFDIDEELFEKQRLFSAQANSKATSFDMLRTKVLLQMQQNNWKRLAITSPMPNCGKTTMACNLALGLGRQDDMRTMLFDFDLRDPEVHNFFGVTPPHPLADVLTRRVDFSDHLMRFGENVAVSMEPIAQADPARLLLSEDTARILDEIEALYKPDMMIFDLPSTLVNDDTLAFLNNADCALIAVWANVTRYNQLDVCEREVSELTNVLGVVLNACRHRS